MASDTLFRHFNANELPKIEFPDDFQGDDIPIDGNAVAALIQQHVQGSA